MNLGNSIDSGCSSGVQSKRPPLLQVKLASRTASFSYLYSYLYSTYCKVYLNFIYMHNNHMSILRTCILRAVIKVTGRRRMRH